MFHLYGDGDLGSVRERSVAVPLLLAKGRPVSRLELSDWLAEAGGGSPGDEDPADDLDDQLVAFRQRLADLGFRQALLVRGEVCRLTVAPEHVDAHVLAAQVAAAGQLDDHTAADRLRTALDLCSGEPLAGLAGHRVTRRRRELREARRDAEIALVRVEFRLGRAEHHVPGLVRLSRERLADTEVVGLTVCALRRTGRQAEAVALYARHLELLVELGRPAPRPMP